jgi:hypothetical protein
VGSQARVRRTVNAGVYLGARDRRQGNSAQDYRGHPPVDLQQRRHRVEVRSVEKFPVGVEAASVGRPSAIENGATAPGSLAMLAAIRRAVHFTGVVFGGKYRTSNIARSSGLRQNGLRLRNYISGRRQICGERSATRAGAIRLCMVGMRGHDNRCAGDQPQLNNNPESDILHGAPYLVVLPRGRYGILKALLSLCPHFGQSKVRLSNPGFPGSERVKAIGAEHFGQLSRRERA